MMDTLGQSTLGTTAGTTAGATGTGPNVAVLEETKGQPAEPISPSKRDKRYDIYAKDFGKAPSALLTHVETQEEVDPEDTEENIHKYGV